MIDPNAQADLQAERYLLSMCLGGGWGAVDFIATQCSAEHFFAHRHREIYESILNLWSSRTEITWEAVVYGLGPLPLEEIQDEENEDSLKRYVYDIHNSVPFERTQAEFLAAKLQSKLQLRRLQEVLRKASDKIDSGLYLPEEITHGLGEQIIMATTGTAHLGRTVGDVLNSGFREELLEQLFDPNKIPGIKTGLWIIDNVLGGLVDGRVYTGLARTGIGKSWWVHWLALEIAKKGARPVIFSTEMGEKEVISRMIYMHAGIDSLPFRSGKKKPDADQVYAIEQATYEVANLPITVVPASSMDVAALSMEVKRQQAKGGANMVFIDHIQGLRAKGLSMAQERELINEVTAATKAMAMNLTIPVMQISHSKREMSGEMTRPSMSDGHGSGSIERDSDSVFSLHPVLYSSLGEATNFSSREKLNEVRERDGKVAMELMWHKSRSGGSPMAIFYLNFAMGGRWNKVIERA